VPGTYKDIPAALAGYIPSSSDACAAGVLTISPSQLLLLQRLVLTGLCLTEITPVAGASVGLDAEVAALYDAAAGAGPRSLFSVGVSGESKVKFSANTIEHVVSVFNDSLEKTSFTSALIGMAERLLSLSPELKKSPSNEQDKRVKTHDVPSKNSFSELKFFKHVFSAYRKAVAVSNDHAVFGDAYNEEGEERGDGNSTRLNGAIRVYLSEKEEKKSSFTKAVLEEQVELLNEFHAFNSSLVGLDTEGREISSAAPSDDPLLLQMAVNQPGTRCAARTETREWIDAMEHEVGEIFSVRKKKTVDAGLISYDSSAVSSKASAEEPPSAPSPYVGVVCVLRPREWKVSILDSTTWQSLSTSMFSSFYYYGIDDDERYSIQTHPLMLRNMIAQSLAPPLGYPAYDGPIIHV
jgi:hypothetical protein